MKKGFTLLEVLIGTLIASILSTMLMYVLAQVTSLQRIVDTRVDMWMPTTIIQNQFERDIMGTFIPQAGFIKPDKKDQNQKDPSLQPQKKQEQKKLENIFYVARNEQGVQTFSLITTSMLPTYKQSKVRAGRVVYSLVQDKEDKRLFSLMRQEGHLFELEEYTKSNSSFEKIELANNIAAMNMRFIVIKPKEDGSGVEFETSDVWPLPKKEGQTGKDKKEQEEEKLVPDFVEVTLTMWRDTAKEKQEAITWYVPVIAVSEQFKKEEKEEKKALTSEKKAQGKDTIKKQVNSLKKPRKTLFSKNTPKKRRTTNMSKYGFPVKMVHN